MHFEGWSLKSFCLHKRAENGNMEILKMPRLLHFVKMGWISGSMSEVGKFRLMMGTRGFFKEATVEECCVQWIFEVQCFEVTKIVIYSIVSGADNLPNPLKVLHMTN